LTTLPTAWPRTGLLSRAIGLATLHALAQQRSDGAWVADPDPRITETALAALALDRAPGTAARSAAQRARAWLRSAAPQDHHPAARAFEDVLRSIALDADGAARPLGLDRPALRDPSMAARVRLLHTVALACAPHAAGFDPVALRVSLAAAVERADRLKEWSRVELWSAHALVESASGEPGRARYAAGQVAAWQSADGGFFGNPVSAALACLALQRADPGSDAARRAAEHLLGLQFPDGTWRFCSSDVWDTTLMVRVLRDEPVFARHALPAAAGFLSRSQNPDGGWPFRSGVESDNDTTATALIALRGASAPAAAAVIREGLRHLAEQQQPDGLWSTWQSAGDPPVQDVNAHVIMALDGYRGLHTIDAEPARAWLAERFEERGRWQADWYRGLPYATAEVLPVFTDREGDDLRQQAAKSLVETRNPDGGWPAEPGLDSCPAATGLALAALEAGGLLDEAYWWPALDYLVESQRPDGTWPGMPLMYGPRPLLTHYQTHTQAFAAMGLCAGNRVLHALGGEREGEGELR
jgi:squalene-hopene/tetraprenyl-beta-curcumene cyclase